jgi:hypothetical protein
MATPSTINATPTSTTLVMPTACTPRCGAAVSPTRAVHHVSAGKHTKEHPKKREVPATSVETVSAFLARGGTIQRIPEGQSGVALTDECYGVLPVKNLDARVE